MLITAQDFYDSYPQLVPGGEDALIATFIGRSDALMAAWCGFRPPSTGAARTMVATDYDVSFDSPGSRIPGILCLCAAPLASVDTVTVGGVVLVEGTDYTVDPDNGRLGLITGGALRRWPVGFRGIRVQFTAGWDPTPPDLVAIAAAEVRHLWDLRNVQGQSQITVFGDSQTRTDLDALVPKAVQQALDPYRMCA